MFSHAFVRLAARCTVRSYRCFPSKPNRVDSQLDRKADVGVLLRSHRNEFIRCMSRRKLLVTRLHRDALHRIPSSQTRPRKGRGGRSTLDRFFMLQKTGDHNGLLLLSRRNGGSGKKSKKGETINLPSSRGPCPVFELIPWTSAHPLHPLTHYHTHTHIGHVRRTNDATFPPASVPSVARGGFCGLLIMDTDPSGSTGGVNG